MTGPAGLAAAAVLWVAAAPAPAATSTPAAQHRIAVEVHGPVAVVRVTRTLPAEGRAQAERLLDLALPEHAALVDLEVADGARWVAAEPVDGARGLDAYVERLSAQGLTPAREPFDDSANYRVRVTPADAARTVELRYRFSLVPQVSDGRARIAFPPSPERAPVGAEVTVTAPGAADVEIAGVRAAAGRAAASGHVSTRAGWEISWAPRAAGPARDAVGLEGTAASARLGPNESVVALAVDARARKAAAAPSSVLLLIDRSRSVGLPGLAAERDLARKLLEALPPATRFDALFFDRGVTRLHPMSRPATREAIAALDAEMVPDRLRNGTDLPAALREAGALLRREASAFGPSALVAVITDGALPEGPDGGELEHALGNVPGVEVTVAAWAVRPPDDEPVPLLAARALRGAAALRGGAFREVRSNELDEAVPGTLATLARGGDVATVRLRAGAIDRPVADRLAPGEGRAGVLTVAGPPPSSVEVAGTAHGARVRAQLRPQGVDAALLRPHLSSAPPTRLLTSAAAVALVEPVARAASTHEAPVRGSLDRTVVRNTLSLAYMPRARACYLGRSGATPALRDLTGRVRLAIDLARGEVGNVTIQSTTLNHPEIEKCLREGAFALDVPRALRSDAPVTAVLNLVFRPRTPLSNARLTPDEAAVGDQIDLVIEELRRAEAQTAPEPPALDRSMIPTR